MAGAEGTEKNEKEISPELLEMMQTELVLFAQRWLDYIANFANYIKRRMYKTGITLPFVIDSGVYEGREGLMVALDIRITIPREIIKKYAELRKKRKIEIPKVPYITLRKAMAAERTGETRAEDREPEADLFKKLIYSDKV